MTSSGKEWYWRYGIGGQLSKQYADGRLVSSLSIPIQWTVPAPSVLVRVAPIVDSTDDPQELLRAIAQSIETDGDEKSIRDFSKLRQRIESAINRGDASEIASGMAALLSAIFKATHDKKLAENKKKGGRRYRSTAEKVINECEDARIAELFRRAQKPNVDWFAITFKWLLGKSETGRRLAYNSVKGWVDIKLYTKWLETQK